MELAQPIALDADFSNNGGIADLGDQSDARIYPMSETSTPGEGRDADNNRFERNIPRTDQKRNIKFRQWFRLFHRD
jgi:hypothetical protein